jgi:hypothetical protein
MSAVSNRGNQPFRRYLNEGQRLNSSSPQKTESRPITKDEKENLTDFFKVHKVATTINSGISEWVSYTDSDKEANLVAIRLFEQDLLQINKSDNLKLNPYKIHKYIKYLTLCKTSFFTKTSLHEYKEQLLSDQKTQIETINADLSFSGNSGHSQGFTESYNEIYELLGRSRELKSAITQKLNSTEESLRNASYDRPHEIDKLLNLSILDVSNEKISIYKDEGNEAFTIKEALKKIKENDSKIVSLIKKQKNETDKKNRQGYDEAKKLLSDNKKRINTEIDKLLGKPNIPPDIKEILTEISEELNPKPKPKNIQSQQNPWSFFDIFTKQEEPTPTPPTKRYSDGFNSAVNIKNTLDKLDDLICQSKIPKQNESAVNSYTKHILSLIDELEKKIDSPKTSSKASKDSTSCSTPSTPHNSSIPSIASLNPQSSPSSQIQTTASSKKLPNSSPPQTPRKINFFGIITIYY